MIKNYFKSLGFACMAFSLPTVMQLHSQTVQTYTYTGSSQQLVVPSCVSPFTVEVWGAQGGSGYSGNTNYGGYAKGVFTFTAGSILNIYVGQQPSGVSGGYNGGGAGETSGFGGGGGTDVRLNGTAYTDRIIVAGGGGGGSYWSSEEVVGGQGGGLTGTNGSRTSYTMNQGGQGGTQTGSGFGTCVNFSVTAMAGGLGYGGTPVGSNCGCDGYGGGGGYYGGAGSGNCRGGGGGSGYISPAATGTAFATGINTGHGKVVISYSANGPAVIASATAAALCTGASTTFVASNVNSYTWSPGGSNATSITVAPTANTTYTLAGTNSLGCVSNAVITVTVSPGTPTIAVTSSTPSTCFGNTVSLSASGAFTYTFSNSLTNGGAFIPPAGVNNYTVSGTNACGSSTTVATITVSVLPVLATASSTLVCSGKAATLTASGASNYTWSAGSIISNSIVVSPVSLTVYTLTGKTGSCSGVSTVTVFTNPNPTITISASSTSVCAGDMVNLTAMGNVLSYTWSPSGQQNPAITDTPTNSILYSVSGTSSLNCISTAQQVVLVNPLPVVNASASSQLVCAADAVTLSAIGADTYVWTGGSGAATSTMIVNPLADEVYTVTGTSSLNCSASATVALSLFAPTIVVSSNTAICLGSNAFIGAGSADSYMWSNGSSSQNITVNPTLTTLYTVTASVNNLNGLACPATNTVMVTVNPKPPVAISANHSVICIGNAAVLTASGAVTYTWTGGAGAILTSTNLVSPIADQGYTVSGTDANGCVGKDTYQLLVSACVGIPVNTINTVDLAVYPNPNSGEFVISADQDLTIEVTDELGQHIKTVTLNKTNPEVKLSNLANGIYFVNGKNENGTVKQKIIVSK